MGTRLIVGVVLIVLGCIAIAVCYLATRNPKPPGWASDTVIGSVILPLVIGALFMGPMLVGEALLFNRDALGFTDIIVALSVLAAGVVILLSMRIPKRVAAYEALQSAAERQKQREEGLRSGGPESRTLRHGA